MKKTGIAIFLCLAFFWGPHVDGSTIQSWQIPQDMSEEDFVEFLLNEGGRTLGQSLKDSDFPTFFHDKRSDDPHGERLIRDFMEVFGREEIQRSVAPYVPEEKQDRKETSAMNIRSLFVDTGKQEPLFESTSLQWVVFIGGLVSLSGALLFKSIPKVPGLAMIVLWLFFWQAIFSAVIWGLSVIDAIIKQL